ncbi:effector protein [Candidatus Phytoplasma oryzae]|nr:effector protein [Candidatus Phytoplasma oryzae]
MYLNLKKIKFIYPFFLIILLVNFYKTNLVFAGKFYSKLKKTESSEEIFDSSKKEIEILTSQIDDLCHQKNLISQEINKSEKDLLFYSKTQSNKNTNISEKDLIYLKFRIQFLSKKKSLLIKQLNELSLEQINLEIKLRKILYSGKN